MEDAEEYQPTSEEIVPVKQETIMFHGKPLIGVVLPDGRPGFVLRSFCDNLQLDRVGQVRRIRRTEAIADDLISNVRIEYPGGPAQHAQVLVLRAVGYWLATIDASRVRPEVRPDILYYQREVVDALYIWAQSRRDLLAPMTSEAQALPEPEASGKPAVIQEVPGRVIVGPIAEPGPEATHRDKTAYHEMMSLWHRYQADQHAQAWRAEVEERIEDQEARIEAKEAVVNLIPEILDRLGPEKISDQQQTNIRGMVKRLVEVSGIPYQTIYWELAQAFQAPRYEEILADQYAAVCEWFKRRMETAKKPRR